MAANGTTISQLLELFNQSKNRGECVSLILEHKDGRDFASFSIGHQAGVPLWSPKTQTSSSTPLRRKTPSQRKRDQRRKEEFIAKKKASLDVKCGESESQKVVKATIEVPVDEINLTK